ncbi:hypothetical protein [Halomonas cerina]|uniref:Uncharacterized protein n=1 Tax=Halomonas cerina TaxID=447424 RepID=A0A839V7P8_9GAMM|nr:hypothetical protein [Halomonas cerina]MBB3191472.1 hypothetical protein [Halomonas cerina]
MEKFERKLDQTARAAWLSYVGRASVAECVAAYYEAYGRYRRALAEQYVVSV